MSLTVVTHCHHSLSLTDIIVTHFIREKQICVMTCHYHPCHHSSSLTVITIREKQMQISVMTCHCHHCHQCHSLASLPLIVTHCHQYTWKADLCNDLSLSPGTVYLSWRACHVTAHLRLLVLGHGTVCHLTLNRPIQCRRSNDNLKRICLLNATDSPKPLTLFLSNRPCDSFLSTAIHKSSFLYCIVLYCIVL